MSRSRRQQLLAEVSEEAPAHAAAAVRLNIAIAQELGMPLADLQCLGLLTAGPAAPWWLTERLGVTTGAVTKLLDRLERAGYVSREPDPDDRRRIIVVADAKRLAELAQLHGPMRERMAQILAGYTNAELEAILTFMRTGRDAADEEIARIRREGPRHAVRRRRRPSSS